jgi:hypothetical protein
MKMQIQKIIAFVKSNWMTISVVLGAILIVVSIVAVIFVFGARRNQVATGSPDNVNTANTALVPAAKTYTDLYAVSIDNHVDARPPSGVNQAAFIYEAPVEGGITRFLAVFERGMNVSEIGPVRSARPYFLDWVLELGPSLFLHVGGSPDALARIAATPALLEADRDGIAAPGFWRDDKRDAPHNVYTSSANVEQMFAARTGGPRTITPWLMAADPAPEARGVAASFTVPMSTDTSYTPEWRYDPSRNVYARFSNKKAQMDRSGAPIETKNVIVMKTETKVLDSVGRLSVATSGSGEAIVYRNGETIAATWKNEVGGSPTRFYGPTGAEVVLTDGNVWVEVVKK